LKLVSRLSSKLDPASGSASAGVARAAGGDQPSRTGWPIWAFVALFVVFALALGWQFRVAGELEAEIENLEGRLAATTSRLGAHQERLIEIRSGVRDLAAHLDGLRALVDAEPADALPASTEPAPDASSLSGSGSGQKQGRSHEIPARLPH
jgi:hypothetical protein